MEKVEAPVIDLDARLAARREQRGEGPKIQLGGKVYDLPPEIPISYLEAGIVEGGGVAQVRAALDSFRALLGEEAYRYLVDEGASIAELNDLSAVVLEAYGLGAAVNGSGNGRSPNGATRRARSRSSAQSSETTSPTSKPGSKSATA